MSEFRVGSNKCANARPNPIIITFHLPEKAAIPGRVSGDGEVISISGSSGIPFCAMLSLEAKIPKINITPKPNKNLLLNTVIPPSFSPHFFFYHPHHLHHKSLKAM
jgi:hypothetical protein